VAGALAFCRAWAEGAQHFTLTTSGSTGTPKPISLTREQMEASARATASALDLRQGMRSLICLPTAFVAGRMMLVRGLVLGLEMTLVPPTSDPLGEGSAGQGFDFAAFVPLQMQTMLDGPADRRMRLNAMHAILVGGAPLSPALEAAIATLEAPVFHTYGMTETATHIALRRLTGPGARAHFVPLPGVETALDDRGCLALRGPMTNGVWVQTNDLVERAGDGGFRWLGRFDLVVNSGGVKVPVEPLEEELGLLLPTLGGAPWVGRRFLVAGLPDERLGEQLVLVVEAPADALCDEESLLASLRERLGRFRSPRRLLATPHFAQTPTGKIDRAATLAAATAR
jgi:O-succinylbenzoic acid--CoA ligase